MSINDPQWGNSHRPEQKDPDQVPESTGTASTQPDAVKKTDKSQNSSGTPQKTPPPPEGPPDLEELWQRVVYGLRCRVARLLRRELPAPPVPPAPASARPTMPTASRSIDEAATLAGWQALSLKSWLIGVSLIIGAWLVSGFYLVDAQQRGVLSRFGQIVSVSDPGWHWRWPYPFETVRLINVEGDRTIEVGLTEQKGRRQSVGLMSTADGNLVNVAFAIVYQVRDPVAYLSKAEVPADLLVLTVEDQLRDVMSRQTLSDVLGSAKQQPTPILKPALASMRSQVESALATLDLGIEIKGIEVREVRLPAAVLSAAKEADRDVQATLRSLRERQGAATEGLIKAYKLSGELGEESAGYVSGLESASRVLTSGSANTDAAALSTTFIELIGGLRQQYPLAFASLADLQQRVSPAAANRDGAKASDKITDIKTAPEAPSAVDWRDRELMRSRDRVDRPGSGS